MSARRPAPRSGAPVPPRFDERAFHRWLAGALRAPNGAPLPMGDDVAAVRWPGGLLLLTTDALVEGTHFVAASPPGRVGAAAVNASLSDLASKGGRPIAVLLTLLLPPETPEAWARAVVRGAERAAHAAGTRVVGGDTKASPRRAVVGTVVGGTDARRLPRRDGACPGDVLLLTGRVGRGGTAMARWARRGAPSARDLAELLRIEPRLAEGRALSRFAHAMIDTSDGLADACWRLAEGSGVRVVVDPPALPWARGLARAPPGAARERTAFYGGDYELLASVPPAAAGPALRAVRATGGSVRRIGRIETGHGAVLAIGPRRRPMPRAGWDPFARNPRAGRGPE